MQCPQSVFDKLLAVCGSGTDDEECLEFAYEAMGSDELYFTDIISLNFGDLKHDDLNNWDAVENWISDLGLRLDLESIFPKSIDDIYAEAILPSALVRDVADLKSIVLRAIKSGYENSGSSDFGFRNIISCLPISNGTEELQLVFTDLDSWSLGHANWVVVVGDLDELSEDSGFYQI